MRGAPQVGFSKESQVFKDEVLAGAESADPSTRGDAGATRSYKNPIGKLRIVPCVKSFILWLYNVLAKHRLGIRKKQMSAAVLIPGLKVSVDGTGQDATHVLAKSITFDGDDLETAEMIQAGLSPTEQKVAANQRNIEENEQNIKANKQNIASNKAAIDANVAEAAEASKRFSELSDYDTKAQLDVHFASGSSDISEADREALKKLAQNAVNLTGYIIQVKGFADSSGNAAMNQNLSMEREQNVIAFLLQNCNVPVRHIVAPGAMGEAAPVASNETAAGRAENRRVEVKVLLNKGLAGD
jgi:OOP family OmpA-OmpF porin